MNGTTKESKAGLPNYGIKGNYHARLQPGEEVLPYRDTARRSRRYQAEVYALALNIITEYRCATVADIGCGCGHKLAEFIRPVCGTVVGIDTHLMIEYCRHRHAFGQWEADDLEHPRFPVCGPFDLIIAADVIEHLSDPDCLIEYIRQLSHPDTTIIISTPERDRVRGRDDVGPPANPYHVREWNSDEFRRYLRAIGLFIVEHKILFCERLTWIGRMRAALWHPNTRGWHCQVAVCRLNGQS